MSMNPYYVSKDEQPNGEHEIHRIGCPCMPEARNLFYLGEHFTCQTAVAAARHVYGNVCGCLQCCGECRTADAAPPAPDGAIRLSA